MKKSELIKQIANDISLYGDTDVDLYFVTKMFSNKNIDKSEFNNLLNTNVVHFFTRRVVNCLISEGVNTVRDLCSVSSSYLMHKRNFGFKCKKEIDDFFRKYDYLPNCFEK